MSLKSKILLCTLGYAGTVLGINQANMVVGMKEGVGCLGLGRQNRKFTFKKRHSMYAFLEGQCRFKLIYIL